MSFALIARIWYNYIYRAKVCLCTFNEILNVFFVVKICNKSCNLPFFSLKRWKKCIDFFLSCGRKSNLSAFSKESLNDRGSDAAGSTSN